MDNREIRQFTISVIDSPAFPYMFGKAFRPLIRKWLYSLIFDKDLSDVERKSLVLSLEELYGGFVEIYENCDLEIPQWLDEEFYRGLIPE